MKVLLTLLLLPSLAMGQLTDRETNALRQGLYLANLEPADLSFARRAYELKGLGKLGSDALGNPLGGTGRLMELAKRSADASPPALLEAATFELLGDSKGDVSARAALPSLPEEIEPGLRQALAPILSAVIEANRRIRGALSKLSPTERRTLIEGLPLWAASNRERFDFTGPDADSSRAMSLLGKVDLAAIRAASKELASAISSAIPSLLLEAKRSSFAGRTEFKVEGIEVVLAGKGDDVHRDKDAAVVIDLGGDDRYVGRHGAGVASAAVLMDVAGDDQYREGDLTLGAGLLGAGLVYDLAGDDIVQAGSLSMGASVAGVGVFANVGGADYYSGGSLTQGFGALGIGVFVETAGNDVYRARDYAQGSARPGGVGWLVDRAGSDRYMAGSWSQGAAFGDGPMSGALSGGSGLLTDAGGDDKYDATTFSQAAAGWGGTAALSDLGGDDSYSLSHHGQASAQGMSFALLVESEGNDEFVAAEGASQALASDFGVAVLLERGGDDVYAGRNSRPATAGSGGLALMLDADGDDRYLAPAGLAPGSGAIAIFVDGGGFDSRADVFADELALAGGGAFSLDLRGSTTNARGVSLRTRPTPGSVTTPPAAQIDELLLNARNDEPAMDRLVGIGMPALQRALSRLGQADDSDLLVIEEMVRQVGQPGRAAIAPMVADAEPSVAFRALSIVATLGIVEAAPYLARALDDQRLARSAARAAGIIRAADLVPNLLALSASGDGTVVASALTALASIGDRQAAGTAVALLGSRDALVRLAAADLLARFPADARAAAERMIAGEESQARRAADVLSRLQTPDALDRLGRLLDDPRKGVRLSALAGLAGRVPEAYLGRVQELTRDPDDLVRAAARAALR